MPFYGYRRVTAHLRRNGCEINEKRVLGLMRQMRLQALYPRPNTSMPSHNHQIFPYLLKGLDIARPNQVWATDITYIKMPVGFAYLVALIDVHSRYLMAWRLSNTMDTHFCLEMLDEALCYACPEILNTDQGSQFTSHDWITGVQGAGIRVSMDGKGRWVDNVVIERFWRTLKHEHVLLHSFEDLRQARRSIGAFIKLYNFKRLHQHLGYQTPVEVYGAAPKHLIAPPNPGFSRPVGDVYNLTSKFTTSPQAQQQLVQ